MNLHLLIIDGQRDFADPSGSLFVPGAPEDMDRLATFIHRNSHRIADIHCTMDSHQPVDIAHPIWFVSADDGTPPPPFTTMKVEGTGGDAKIMGYHFAPPLGDGRVVQYHTKIRAMERGGTGNPAIDGPTGKGTIGYLRALEAGGRYPHMIWPPHCQIGTEGHALVSDLWDAVQEWTARFGTVDFVAKGSNIWTEHFSAVQAEVPFPGDPSTQLNRRFVDTLETADEILVAGEAFSHCVANTLMDVVRSFGDPDSARKIVVLEDAMSPVPGCDFMVDDFRQFAAQHGIRFSTTTAYFS